MALSNTRLLTAFILAGFLAGTVACTGARRAAVLSSPSPPLPVATGVAGVPNLYEDQRQVEAYITSGRYDQDFAKVTAGGLARGAGKDGREVSLSKLVGMNSSTLFGILSG